MGSRPSRPHLSITFPTEEGAVRAVSNLSDQARLGRTIAIVGESGSGKSVSSLAVLGLHSPKRTVITGSITLDGQELVGAPESTFRRLRSTTAAMVPGPTVLPAPLPQGGPPDRRGRWTWAHPDGGRAGHAPGLLLAPPPCAFGGLVVGRLGFRGHGCVRDDRLGAVAPDGCASRRVGTSSPGVSRARVSPG